MGNIDFIEMFMACLQDNASADGFSSIYDIDFEAKPIRSKALSAILSPLLIVQFLMVVRQISSAGLRKDYISRTENLSKIKGRLNLLPSERLAITGHGQMANCTFDEYSVDTAENRLLKRALVISSDIISMMRDHHSYPKLSAICNHCLSAFENVTLDNSIRSIVTKGNKLYHQYASATKLAQMIIRRQDIAVNPKHQTDYDLVPVFRLDMALLFEHYTLALLRKAFGKESVLYQTPGCNGRFYPDFVICKGSLKAIVDAKYVDADGNNSSVLRPEYIKQLSAYCRDRAILQKMGYNNVDFQNDNVPIIPCVLAYPSSTGGVISEQTLLSNPDNKTLKFYTLPVRIPTV